jgi:hypothetical protein
MRCSIPIIQAAFFLCFLNPVLTAGDLHEAIRSSAHTTGEIIDGSSVETLDEICDGVAAIHIAVEKGNYEVVRHLLDKRANVNILNDKNESPAFIALEKKFRGIFKLLMEHNGSLRGEDVYDRLQLMPRSASDPVVLTRHDDLTEEDFSPINLSEEQTTTRKLPRRIDTTNHKKKKLTNKNSKTKLLATVPLQEPGIATKQVHRYTTYDVPKKEQLILPLGKLPTVDPDMLRKIDKADFRVRPPSVSLTPFEKQLTIEEFICNDDGKMLLRHLRPSNFTEGKLATKFTDIGKKL